MTRSCRNRKMYQSVAEVADLSPVKLEFESLKRRHITRFPG